MNPSGYRKARRAMALAAELRLPLVTIVDTPGAELSEDAERGGLAGQIAGCLADMAALPVPDAWRSCSARAAPAARSRC